MAKLIKDEELFNLLQPVIKEYLTVGGDKSSDALIKKLARYPDLEDKAFAAITYPDHMFGHEKKFDRALRSYLFDLKEEAVHRDIAGIYQRLTEEPRLHTKILDVVKKDLDPDIDSTMATVEDVFDETLFHDRTDRWVTGKDGKEYLRQASTEVRRNELLRQLSDLPYVDLPDKIQTLREQYEQISGENYDTPATTYKREYVTLRQKLGIAIAKKGNVFDSIKEFDPAYDYRRIADRIGRLNNGTLSKEQQEFLEQQVRYLNSDVSVLRDYEKLASQISVDIKLPKSMSVKDKISEYRKQLGGRLQEISGNVDISKKSLAYLDLVESKKKDNPELYKKTVEELSKEPGIGGYRAARWSTKKNPVPLTAWQEIGLAVQQRKEQLKVSTRVELEQDTWDNFNRKVSGEDPKYRSSWGWEETKRDDGTVARHLKGVTKFNGKFYRDSVDREQLLADYANKTNDDVTRIVEAKKRILDNLNREIQEQKQADRSVAKLEERLVKQQQDIVALEQKSYSYDNIGSYDRRAATVKEAADLLSVKADILETDPAFDFNKVLRGINREDRVNVLLQAKERLGLTVKPIVSGYQEKLKQQGLSIPSWVGRQSLEEQLAWHRASDTLISDIEKKSYAEFSTAVSSIGYSKLQRQLPVGFLQRLKGNVYRSTVDADAISKIAEERQNFSDQEARILTGPLQQKASNGLSEFGKKLLASRNKNQTSFSAATVVSEKTGADFSSAYKDLSANEKKVYDRNFGQPVREGDTFYKSIYDMPDDVWERAEKAAGFEVPRQRGAMISSNINVEEEKKVQADVTKDLQSRTWEPVKREDKTVAVEEQKKVLEEITESKEIREENKRNLRKMLQKAEKSVKQGGIGSMGMAAAFVLFNAAMTGPSREAEEHRRRVEEERRIKKYGYNYQQ